MPFLILTLLALLWVAWLLGQPRLTERRRQRLRQQPFPAAWRAILQRRVPYVRALPTDLQLRLKEHIQVFLAEKAFIGCQGQEIDDEIRVTIAAQACLLLLGQAQHNYYPGLRQVLVYPASFVVRRSHTDGTGIQHQDHQVLAGESWQQGQVILSWHDSLEGAANPGDGHNVVIHEFAHQLDQATGSAKGAPALAPAQDDVRWSAVLGAEFAALQARVQHGETSLLDDYGATDPAEFFAVATEVFFEQPERLAEEHPALYKELSVFYGLQPLGW